MNAKKVIKIAALFGALSVVIGAFGAHALEGLLIEYGRIETFETGVKYQFYHTIALLLTGVLMQHNTSRYLGISALLFTVGIVIFSGSLYVLSITNYTVLGAITPIGGLSFILAWLLVFKAMSAK